MSIWKKVIAVALALTFCCSLFACSTNANTNSPSPSASASAATPASSPSATPSPSPSAAKSSKFSDGGKTLRVYCWNDEFQKRFKAYYESKLPSDVKVEFIITPNANNAYQNKLDADLQTNVGSSAPIDLYLIEADYAIKYCNSDYTLDIQKDVGLTESDLSNQYQYTKDIVKDSKGNLKGTSWQATPGLFAYRRSIAKQVLGTDDPDKVQAALSDWSKFDAAAAKMSAAGFKMLSGYDDSYRAFSNNSSKPWVDSKNVIQIDPAIKKWIDQTKTYTDKGYNNKSQLWDTQWAADQGPGAKTFGFFYSTWGINFSLLGYSLATPVDNGGKKEVGNGLFGDWATCPGPQPFYWGGSWICAAPGTDNIGLVKDIMKTMTCDKATMLKLTQDTEDYTNNKAAMDELANSNYASAFLGGQNHIKLFAAAAQKISMKNMTAYDQGLNESLQNTMKDYFDGTVTYEQALANFYKSATEKYPDLKKPS